MFAPRRDLAVQVQLVFRTEEGDYFEMRDSSADFEAHLPDKPLRKGEVITAHGCDWIITEASDGNTMPRFVCVPLDDFDSGVGAPLPTHLG